jgi:hypothetical protein
MAQYRNFDIELTIVPDVAGQYEAAFSIREAHERKHHKDGKKPGEKHRAGAANDDDKPEHDKPEHDTPEHDTPEHDTPEHGRVYKFPPVGSYFTPDDAREQTEAWAHKWIDENFPE